MRTRHQSGSTRSGRAGKGGKVGKATRGGTFSHVRPWCGRSQLSYWRNASVTSRTSWSGPRRWRCRHSCRHPFDEIFRHTRSCQAVVGDRRWARSPNTTRDGAKGIESLIPNDCLPSVDRGELVILRGRPEVCKKVITASIAVWRMEIYSGLYP